MAGLRPPALPRSGLVHRRDRHMSQDLFVGEFSSILAPIIIGGAAPRCLPPLTSPLVRRISCDPSSCIKFS